MPCRRPLILVGLALMAWQVAAQDVGERGDLQAPLQASVRFVPDADIVPGHPFSIAVQFSSAAGAGPPVGLEVSAWLRPLNASNLPCNEAARAYRSTLSLPTDAISLNGPVLAVAMADGAVTFADPDLDLASANIIAAAKLEELPTALVPDPARQRVLAVLEGRGEIVAIAALTGEIDVLARGFDRPGTVIPAPDGGAWVLDAGTSALIRVLADGSTSEAVSGVTSLTATPGGGTAVYSGPGKAALFDLATGRDLARFPVKADASAALPLGDPSGTTGIAVLSADRLEIYYTDAPDLPFSIALPAPATRLAAPADGRFLFAYDPAGGPVLVVDTIRGRVVQAVGADVPIIEIAFTERAAFLLRADQQSAGALFFDTIRADEPARVREVVLGTPQAGKLPDGVWMAPLSAGRELVAVHAGSYSGFVLHDNPAMSDKTWPMTRVQLRGGEPRRIAVLDRSFRETGPGVFEGTAMLPAVGAAWQLVLTTGLGGQTVCFTVPTRAEVTAAVKGPGTILAERDDAAIRLALVGPDGTPARRIAVRLTFSAPQANWRRSAELKTDSDGRITTLFRLPDTRPLIITAETDGGRAFLPLAIED
jgi:hypothetical protein